MKRKLTKVWLGRDEDEGLWWYLYNPLWGHWLGEEWLVREQREACASDAAGEFEEKDYDCNFKLPAPGKKVEIWIEL